MKQQNYDEIIYDFEILNVFKIMTSIDNQIKAFSYCKDCIYAFTNIADLIYQKQWLIRKYQQFKQILKYFNTEEKTILYLYFFKNVSCFELAKKYNISLKTFFRKIKFLNEKYIQIKKIKEAER